MKWGIRAALFPVATLTAFLVLCVPTAWAPPRGGSAERVVLDDRNVCRDGGEFMIGYSDPDPPPSPIQRPNRIEIIAPSWSVSVNFTLQARPIKFNNFVNPGGDPLGANGVRAFRARLEIHWPQRTARGTALKVLVHGDPDASPEEFPAAGTPAITVRSCTLF